MSERELDDATVEAIADYLARELPTLQSRLGIARDIAAALPDPRPTEAEVRQDIEDAISDEITGAAAVDLDRAVTAVCLVLRGCFRPEPAENT